jgi:ankyrin repeat protein
VSVVESLLVRDDFDPNTGLHALGYSVHFIVKLLLDCPDTDPDLVMEGGRSALMLAATSKSEMVINLLLDRGGIDVNRQDDLGRTALGEAARFKCFENVKLLLGRDYHPNLPDNFGHTVLFWACDSECLSVVNLRLGREDVNPNARNDNCYTPLARACLLRAQLLCAHFFFAASINNRISDVTIFTQVIKYVTHMVGNRFEVVVEMLWMVELSGFPNRTT